jgi:hypothetical protein
LLGDGIAVNNSGKGRQADSKSVAANVKSERMADAIRPYTRCGGRETLL